MLTRIDLRGFDGDVADRLPRPALPAAGPVEAVREILAAVATRGDEALRELTRRFDGVELVEPHIDPTEISAALERIEPDLRAALVAAAASISAYHEAQLPVDVAYERPGLSIAGLHRPVERAGCYVPGGRAIYPSTVLMTAVPARVAGVDEIVLSTPPGPDGRVPDITLAAAAIAGVDEVIAVGGAQAIGAMAYGTATIRAVDVIVGPGNVYVALAKQQVAGVVGVPSSFSGPSEVVVVCDGSAPAEFAAIDVIAQAEHGPDGLAWLVTWEATLDKSGYVVVCDTAEQALAVSNFIAPEHLELQTADPGKLLDLVRHAGAVFCGPWAPASLGDYVAGPSHVLPTNGTARFAGALNVRDFMRDLHVITVDQAGFESMGDHVEVLAGAEGLDAHAATIRIRRGADL